MGLTIIVVKDLLGLIATCIFGAMLTGGIGCVLETRLLDFRSNRDWC